jgi:DNA-directed RNA polymerase specialized sigma subunit
MTLDPKTEKEMFQKHAPLVGAMVRQFVAAAPQVFSREQLHNFGLVALLGAVRSRQRTGSVSFESFARSYIHDAMLGEVRRQKNWLAGSSEESMSHLARV